MDPSKPVCTATIIDQHTSLYIHVQRLQTLTSISPSFCLSWGVSHQMITSTQCHCRKSHSLTYELYMHMENMCTLTKTVRERRVCTCTWMCMYGVELCTCTYMHKLYKDAHTCIHKHAASCNSLEQHIHTNRHTLNISTHIGSCRERECGYSILECMGVRGGGLLSCLFDISTLILYHWIINTE